MNNRLSCLTLALTVAFSGTAWVVLAQTPRSAAAGAGLNALDESTVRVELAGRGMEDLLNRSFEVGKVPEAERKAIMAGLALQSLANQDISKLNARQRRELVGKLSGDLDKTIATLKDHKAIMKLANQIMAIGVLNEVSLIEFWGEDPTTQAQLRPAAEAALKLYTKALAEITNKVNAVANQINNPNQDALMNQLAALQKDQLTIEYTKFSSQYFAAMALDKADPRRKTLVDEAVTFLGQYDNADSGIQAGIKLQVGKMLIVKGDFPKAIETLLPLVAKPADIKPAPSSWQQSEARVFTAIAELLARNADAADKQLKETIAWQKANLPDPNDARLAADATTVLQARILWLRAELATAQPDKDKANEQASALLTQLMKDRPQLAPLILEILVTRLPQTADLTKLDKLLLQALIQRGKVEIGKKEGEPVDKPQLEKALAAAREQVKRKGQPGVDPATVENTTIAIPLFAQKLGQPKVAAAAFLDYLQSPGADEARKTLALNEAMNIILGELKAPNNSDPEVAALYDRAVPIAINAPYNHKELAYGWSRRMQKLQKTDEAIKYLRLVPADAPVALNAKYYLAIALNTKLDDPKLPAKDRTAIGNEIVKTAEELSKAAQAGLAGATDDKKKNMFRQMLGGTKLTSATVALDIQNDPKRTLAILSDIEATVGGMPGGEELVVEALGIRARAHMALGQDKEAVAILVDFAKKRPQQAIGMVAQLKDRLTKEIDKARLAGDTKRVAALAPARATLLQFMADWVRNNADPKVKEQAFEMDKVLVDAKREAALLEPDAGKKKTLLQEVAKLYDNLRAQPKGASDPYLACGLGLISFDIGDYQKCIDLIGPLLRDRRLGQATLFVAGQPKDNELYWEARFKLLRSFMEIAKKNGDQKLMEDVKSELRLLFVANGTNTGGQKWGPEFEKLRKEVDPTIDPTQGGAGSAEGATTQPANNVE